MARLQTAEQRAAWVAELDRQRNWRHDISLKVGGWVGAPGNDVNIDGDYTAEELRHIADALDQWNKS